MPKLRSVRSLVSRPFWCPSTSTLWPLKRARPPRIDMSSVNERVGPLRMARQLGHLPWRELGVDVFHQRLALFLQAVDLFRDIQRRFVLYVTQLFDLRLELSARLLEFQERRLAH